MKTLGPWTLGAVISDVGGKKIISVTPTACVNPEEDTMTNEDCKLQWVAKVRSNSCLEEVTDLINLVRMPPRNMVEMPETAYHQFGLTRDSVWFAMRQYDSHLKPRHSSIWRDVAIACIRFMSDLHRHHERVYMDFRMENILVAGANIVVADYELVTTVSSLKTKTFDAKDRWYFLAHGAKMNEWLYSWRMDLVSLGYVLVALTEGHLPFFSEFMNRRIGKRCNHKSTRDLLKERDAAVWAASNPTIRSYFDKIEEVEWSEWFPPALSFYKELEELFTSQK